MRAVREYCLFVCLFVGQFVLYRRSSADMARLRAIFGF